MSRIYSILPAALALLATAGCTSPVEIPVVQQPTVALFAFPRDKVWTALVGTWGSPFPSRSWSGTAG